MIEEYERKIYPLGEFEYDEARGKIHFRDGFLVKEGDKIYVGGEQTYCNCYTRQDCSIVTLGDLEDSVIITETPVEKRDIFRGYSFRGRGSYDNFLRDFKQTVVFTSAIGLSLGFIGVVGLVAYKTLQHFFETVKF